MEKLLLFGITDTTFHQIKSIASRMKISCIQTSSDFYSYTLEQILNNNAPNTFMASSDKIVSESLLVICGLSDKRVDKLLFELRRSNVTIDYKALLTPTNRNWTVSQLLLEMHREKAAYQRMQP